MVAGQLIHNGGSTWDHEDHLTPRNLNSSSAVSHLRMKEVPYGTTHTLGVLDNCLTSCLVSHKVDVESGSRIWLDSQENPQVTPLKLRTWKRAYSMLFSSCRASTWSAKRGAAPRHFPVAYHSSPYTGRSGAKLGSSNTPLAACTKRHKVPHLVLTPFL